MTEKKKKVDVIRVLGFIGEIEEKKLSGKYNISYIVS
jgi:hypothetical protein